ncbi:MAG: hypothetical protein Q9220_005745 [cf. Caloplaca sp. 1 TL-2023]
MASLRTRDNQASPTFCGLPLEVRNQIYSYLLVDNESIYLELEENDHKALRHWDWRKPMCYDHADGMPFETPYWPCQLQTNLLFVSKTIYEEASTIFYGSNTFGFTGASPWTELGLFINRMSTISRESLRSIEIEIAEFDFTNPESKIDLLLCQLPNLGALKLHVIDNSLANSARLQYIWDALKNIRLVRICFGVIDPFGVLEQNVKISTMVITHMREWGWTTEGSYELIDAPTSVPQRDPVAPTAGEE